jgi:tRNA(Ile)-lysidine synthase
LFNEFLVWNGYYEPEMTKTEKAWRGMLPQNGKVIRPMLPILPSQVKEYLEGNNKVWREDSSNSKLQYLRNKVRHGIIGMMEEPELAMKEFSLLSEKMYQEWRHQELAHSDIWQWEELKQGYWQFKASDLQKFPFVWKQILMQLGFAADCWKYLVSDSVRVGAQFLSNQGYRVVRARDGFMMLFKDIESDFTSELFCNDSVSFEFAGQHFRFIRATDLKEGMQVLGVLPQKIEDKKCLLRSIKAGDRIPLSGGGSQKVSDFMTNKKWDPFQKSRALGLEVEGKLLLVFSLGCIQEKWNLKDGLLVNPKF